jgi:hypothetical protein
MFYMKEQILIPTERTNEQVVKPCIIQIGTNPALAKLLFSIKETAQILSMSEKSVRRLIARGLLQANPALRIKLVTAESILAFARMTMQTIT